MRNYETTFIVDPVLSTEDIKSTAQTYVDKLRKEGCEIVFVDEMGLRTLAYDINKRSNGIYYSIEYTSPNGAFIRDFELALRRDERILRFLTIALDKYGVQYNADKRAGKIGKAKRQKQEKAAKTEASAHGISRKKADSPSLSGVPSGDAESFKEEE
ncbi:30S ribosomal protein S6 [Neolewinella agarilytica]|uniref:Small ribosomal subunit protein bS6 n=1 Tax=Neolewinella agarilytica TaxID=478744 RepID=A0A1H9NY40_9BACT|nr:30S ribosomal protein S6 [Neolewinella agarilytica]SER40575.1 SSU ribosomal protein S6P [Neolewinella agarilytica]